jgi:(p)ppGpp synthase/HD superfamily hydrolase
MDRIGTALALATKLHEGQIRTGADGVPYPYIAHPMAVAALVLEHGGTGAEVAAALLHDGIEDGPPGSAEAIGHMLGAEVLAIVRGCSDSEKGGVVLPWKARKIAYLGHLENAPPNVKLVSCADKFHNASAIVSDLKVLGPPFFKAFAGGQDGVLWYYEELVKVFNAGGAPAALARKLAGAVAEMKKLALGCA